VAKQGRWIFDGAHNARVVAGVTIAKAHSCVVQKTFKDACRKSGAKFLKCADSKKTCFLYTATGKKGFRCQCDAANSAVFSYLKKACVCLGKSQKWDAKKRRCLSKKEKKAESSTCPSGSKAMGQEGRCRCTSPNRIYHEKKRRCLTKKWSDYRVLKPGNIRPKGRKVRGCSARILLNGKPILHLGGYGASNKGWLGGGAMKARRKARDTLRACFEQIMKGKLDRRAGCRQTYGWKHVGVKRIHPTDIRKLACKQARKNGRAQALFKLETFHKKGGSRNKNCRFKTALGFFGKRHVGFSTPIWCK
jgi:hypothetical protein